MLEVADIFRLMAPLIEFGDRMLPSHRRAMQDIETCRTENLGGQVYFCKHCQSGKVLVQVTMASMNSHVSPWCLPPKRLLLKEGEVHVWRAGLDRPSFDVHTFLHLLTTDERERAERFYFQRDRDRFIVARGVLRTILSSYLHVKPDELRFCYNSYGKPALIAASGGPLLRFNLAHSGGLALYALTLNREIGIDLEYIREDFASEQLAEQFFSHREVEMLRALPANMRTEGFFNCWTRKEAYIKGRGQGLSFPLNQFVVSVAPGEPATLLSVEGDPQEASRWCLQELTPGPGYVASIAVEGCDWELKCWQ